MERLPFPRELIPLISDARYLPYNEINEKCRVNKQFNSAICNNDHFWKLVAEDRLTDDVENLDTVKIKRGLQILDHINELAQGPVESTTTDGSVYLMQDYELPIHKYLRILAARGYDKAVLDFLQTHPGNFSRRAAAVEGAIIGNRDDFAERIFQLAINDADKRRLHAHAFLAAIGTGNFELAHKYLPFTDRDDIEAGVEDALRYLGDHPGRQDIIDLLIEIIGDDYDLRYSAFINAIKNNVREIFEEYLEDIMEDDKITALGITIIRGLDEYFRDILQNIVELEQLGYPLSLAIVYNRPMMVDAILDFVGDNPDIAKEAFRWVTQRLIDRFPTFELISKLLPFVTEEQKEKAIIQLEKFHTLATDIVTAELSKDEPSYKADLAEQQSASRFLDDYDSIIEALQE